MADLIEDGHSVIKNFFLLLSDNIKINFFFRILHQFMFNYILAKCHSLNDLLIIIKYNFLWRGFPLWDFLNDRP